MTSAPLAADRIAAESANVLDRISPYILHTPLVTSEALSRETGAKVMLKCEHRQKTGSFKLRGALNKALQLPRRQLDDGVVVASTGNHGAAVAHACRLLGGKCTVVVPNDVSPVKESAMRNLGAQIKKHGDDGLEAESFAREWAASEELAYISPYNDPDVIIGQSTVATEMTDQLDADTSVYVAVGGGGLISGMAAVLKARLPGIRIVGCSPANHPVMDASVRAGHIVDLPFKATLSDGTAGGIEHNAITLPLCSELVDEWVRVTEEEISSALRLLVRSERLIVEGSAAVAVAALQKNAADDRRTRVAVLCGGNIDRDLLAGILADA